MIVRARVHSTKNGVGFTPIELEYFLFNNKIDMIKFNKCLGVQNVKIINGDVVFDRQIIIDTLNKLAKDEK